MPLHDYQSSDGKVLEKYFSIKDQIPQEIEENGVVYRKIFSVPAIIIDSKQPKTIGGLADKNTAKMEKEGKIKRKPKSKPPWWRPGKAKPDLSLTRMSPAQQARYIREGKK